MCQDYIVNDKDYDFKISTNEDELLKEKKDFDKFDIIFLKLFYMTEQKYIIIVQ